MVKMNCPKYKSGKKQKMGQLEDFKEVNINVVEIILRLKKIYTCQLQFTFDREKRQHFYYVDGTRGTETGIKLWKKFTQLQKIKL